MSDYPEDALIEPAASTVRGRCPYLGVPIDPQTWFATPSAENYCHKADPPQPVRLGHQNACCLAEFPLCPIYKHRDKRWRGRLPKQIQGWLPKYMEPARPQPYLWAAIAVVIVILLILALVFGSDLFASVQSIHYISFTLIDLP